MQLSDSMAAFSILFFSADSTSPRGDRYRAFLSAARFADEAGFEAVWMPERHFASFGGLYANPAVAAAAVAGATRTIAIRAGSVILPLHEPLRVAEEWAMVDNLSDGRVGIAFGSGWHVDDFVLAPARYPDRKPFMLERIEEVRALWRGEAVIRKNGAGVDRRIRTYPRPVQANLPIWLTAESRGTFELAAKGGMNVLTALMHQSVSDLAENIEMYRALRAESGYDPSTGRITLMQHAYLTESEEEVRHEGLRAFRHYIRANLILQTSNATGQMVDEPEIKITEDDLEDIVERTFTQHLEGTGLIGMPNALIPRINRLSEIGVDEIACLIDFPTATDEIMRTMRGLKMLRDEVCKQ